MRFISLLIVLLLSSEFCFATEPSAVHHDGRIYDEVLARCIVHESQTEFFFRELDKATKIASQTAAIGLFQMEAVVEMAKHKGLSAETYEKLTSDGFYAAIDACYPNDPYRRFTYIAFLLGSELDARLVGASLATLLIWAPVKFMGMLNASIELLPAAWARAGSYMMKALSGSLYFAGAAAFYSSARQSYEVVALSFDPTRKIRGDLAQDRDKLNLLAVNAIESQIARQRYTLAQTQMSVEAQQDLQRKIQSNEDLLSSLREKLHLNIAPFLYDSSYTGI